MGANYNSVAASRYSAIKLCLPLLIVTLSGEANASSSAEVQAPAEICRWMIGQKLLKSPISEAELSDIQVTFAANGGFYDTSPEKRRRCNSALSLEGSCVPGLEEITFHFFRNTLPNASEPSDTPDEGRVSMEFDQGFATVRSWQTFTVVTPWNPRDRRGFDATSSGFLPIRSLQTSEDGTLSIQVSGTFSGELRRREGSNGGGLRSKEVIPFNHNRFNVKMELFTHPENRFLLTALDDSSPPFIMEHHMDIRKPEPADQGCTWSYEERWNF